MPETPRTWTLNFQNGMFFPLADGKKREDRIEVIEKAPVDAERERMLDVLERLRPIETPEYCNCDQCEAWRDVTALLSEHGRL